MKSAAFQGVGVAIVTPFQATGAIDEAAFERLVDWHISEGTNFIVPCGTTGENPALTHEEHLRVVELAVRKSGGRCPILAGAGSNNTPKAVELARAAVELGADGILSITPYYNKPTSDGLVRHFSQQAEAVEKLQAGFPIIVYNVPGRTGCNMTAPTTLRLAREIPHIIGVKEASANMEQILQLLAERTEGFLVLSGDDAWTLPLIGAGADGLISVAANEVPREMSTLVALARGGDFPGARKIHNRLLPLLVGNFLESNPIPVKFVMKRLGILENDLVRSPLAPITAGVARQLDLILESCGLKIA